MKTARTILVLFVVSLSFRGLAQKKFNFISGMAFQEFDILSKNQPFGGAVTAKLGPVFIQGDYRHSASFSTQYQVLPSRDSYGGRIGFMVSNFGFTAGFQKLEVFKKLAFDPNERPVDVNDVEIDIPKVQTPLEYTQFSLGFHAMILNTSDKAEKLMDEFDLKMNKNKKRFSTMFMYIDMLYSPKLNHSNTFAYSPYGYYIPRDLSFVGAVKEKHFGVRMRMEYTTAAKIGLLVDMGVFPGIAHKTSGYNDFNFGIRFGILANFSAFTKDKDE